jgi:hypothetical protein
MVLTLGLEMENQHQHQTININNIRRIDGDKEKEAKL